MSLPFHCLCQILGLDHFPSVTHHLSVGFSFQDALQSKLEAHTVAHSTLYPHYFQPFEPKRRDRGHRKANILLWCAPGFPASLNHISAFLCSAVPVDCKPLQTARNLEPNWIVWSRADLGELGWWLYFPFHDCVVELEIWNTGQVHDLKPDKEWQKGVQVTCQTQQTQGVFFKKIRFGLGKVTEYLTIWVSPAFETTHLKSTSGHVFRIWLYPSRFCEYFALSFNKRWDMFCQALQAYSKFAWFRLNSHRDLAFLLFSCNIVSA